MAEDKARDRRASLDSGRERNAVFRSQGPDVARMDFINGLLGRHDFPVGVAVPAKWTAVPVESLS